MATEYIAAIALVVVGVAKTFGVVLGQDTVTGLITAILAIWVAIKRHQQGDISLAGFHRA